MVWLRENKTIGSGYPLVNYLELDIPHTYLPVKFIQGKYRYDDHPILTEHNWPVIEEQKYYNDPMSNVNLGETLLSDYQLEDFKQFLQTKRPVFANRSEELTQSTLPGHVIDTIDAIPVRQQAYQTIP